jgi:hypothetical protein
MHIETTLNISTIHLEKLSKFAGRYNISKSELVSRLILKIIACKTKTIPCKAFCRLRYQKARTGVSWQTLHVVLASHVYEYCCDCRKFFKASVSSIVAEAIDKMELDPEYLDQKNVIPTDNYLGHYVSMAEKDDGIQSFTIFWGFPGKKILKKSVNKEIKR